MFGGDVCGSHAAPTSDPITPQNVARLTVKWKFTAAGDISATPAVVGGQVYVGDWAGTFYRLDAATGQLVWSVSVPDILNPASTTGDASASTTGDASASTTGDASASTDGGSEAGAAEVADSGPADGPIDSQIPDGATPDAGASEAAAADASDQEAEPAPGNRRRRGGHGVEAQLQPRGSQYGGSRQRTRDRGRRDLAHHDRPRPEQRGRCLADDARHQSVRRDHVLARPRRRAPLRRRLVR